MTENTRETLASALGLDKANPITGFPQPNMEEFVTRSLDPQLIRTKSPSGYKAGASLYQYWINFPFPLDPVVWRTMHRQQLKAIQDYDNSHSRQFFDVFPELDMHEDTNDTTLAGAVEGMVVGMKQRFHIVHWVTALYLNRMLWLQVQGLPISSRIAFALKFSKLNTLLKPLQGMPLHPGWLAYLVSQQRALIFDRADTGISVALPLYMDAHDNFVAYSYGTVDDDGSTRHSSRSISSTTPDRRFPYLTEWQDDGPMAAYAEAVQGEGLPDMPNFDEDSATTYQSGVFANWLYNSLYAAVNTLRTSFPDILDPTNGRREFMTTFLGCTAKFNTSELSKMVRSIEPLDGPQFVKEYMMLGSKFQAVYPIEGYSDGWDLSLYDDDDDAHAQLEYEGLRQSEDLWHSNLQTDYTYDGIRFHCLQLFISANSVDKTQEFIGGDFSFLDTFREDKSHITMQLGGDLNNGWNATWGEAETVAHLGDGWDLILSAYDLMFTGRPVYLQSKDEARNMIERGERFGNRVWVDPAHIESGTIAFRSLFRPSINTWDPYQCGFAKVLSYDDYNDPWQRMLQQTTNVYLDSDQAKAATTGIWEDAGSRPGVKDAILWVGDAIGLAPEQHFSRMDIAAVGIDSALNKAATPNALGGRPFTMGGIRARAPYLVNGLSSALMSQYGLNGAFDATSKLPTFPATYDVTAFGFDQGAADEADAAVPVNPYLCYDEARPYPVANYGLLAELENKAISVIEGAGAIPDPSPISGSTANLDDRVRMVLDIVLDKYKRKDYGKKEKTYSRGNRKDRSRPRNRNYSKRVPERSDRKDTRPPREETPEREDVSSRKKPNVKYKADEIAETVSAE
jgi:hypothetical protein